ncbi:MAG: Lrp/AsnC family transcriptional regulator, partial [Thermoplasmata archaeon]|nr:Lrp/AsnC family transcriptional regulator [Thermoplasmata archaeon]
MDDLDMGILREMSRGPAVFWGGMDPRVGTAEIADHLGVNRTTVWSRLRSWEKDGFLIRQEVVPNPRLFGAGVAGGGVRVDDPRRKAEVLRELALVDGVIGGVDHVGPWMSIQYAHESMAALKRCGRLVGALPGVDEVGTCLAFDPPRHSFEPDRRDWRILAAMRRAP